jgi:hypothetical protein
VAHQAQELSKRAGIGERVEALAHGELAAPALTRDALLAAHLAARLPAPLELFDFFCQDMRQANPPRECSGF